MQAFDPSKPLVGDDGLEYEDLGDYVLGKPVACARNDVIASLKVRPSVIRGDINWREAVYNQYIWQNREGQQYAASYVNSETVRARLPQRLDLFAPSPGSPEGAGQPGAVQAPADPVHAADQPTV